MAWKLTEASKGVAPNDGPFFRFEHPPVRDDEYELNECGAFRLPFVELYKLDPSSEFFVAFEGAHPCDEQGVLQDVGAPPEPLWNTGEGPKPLEEALLELFDFDPEENA